MVLAGSEQTWSTPLSRLSANAGRTALGATSDDCGAVNERRVVYGRRQGRKLRSAQQNRLETILPHVSATYRPDAAYDPRRDFQQAHKEIWFEVGFGGGEHLAAQAIANPDVGILGCEPFTNGVAQLLARIDAQNLRNIRIFGGDARDLLEAVEQPVFTKAFVLFPDPWPKARHHKRRFISDESLTLLAGALVDGAELRIATDIQDYCRWTLQHMSIRPEFEWMATGPDDWRVRPNDWPVTRYEEKARRQGRLPVFLKFQRRARICE